jgi:hypothetical protein
MSEREKEETEVQDNAFLGREFLTWLLWRADQGENDFTLEGDTFVVTFAGRIIFGGLAGDVSKGRLDGKSAAYSIEARAAIGAGRTIREAQLHFAVGEREWTCALTDALDLRSVKLPALLTEEEDDRFMERMTLLEELQRMVQAMYQAFLAERLAPKKQWQKVVNVMGQWAQEGLGGG